MAPVQQDCTRGKMAELNVPIYDFRHGVLTPKLKDRPNLDLYKSGTLVGENWLTQLHGPAVYRPGFVHSRTTRRNNLAHYIPFTFSDDESYILSFTEGFMRIFTDSGLGTIPGVLTEDPLAISGITQANPGELTAVGNDFADGDEIFVDDIVGMTELNGQFFLVVGTVTPGVSEMNWPYSVPGNYTYNAADIEVTAGVAKLKITGSSTSYPFTTPANYVFDTDVMEVDGEASLTGIGLVAYAHWKLDESSGSNAADSSGFGRDGTAINMEDGDWVPAKVDNGLLFGGSNEYLDFGDIANFERTDTFSFEFWFKTLAAGAELIFTRQLNAGTFRGWNIFIESGAITTALISDNGVVNRIQRKTNGTFNDGTFHHCVVTYDGSSTVAGLVIHIDDSAVATTIVTDNLSSTIMNAASCQISGRDGPNVVFNGTIDEVAIYTKVLSGAEITARYNSGSGTNLMQYSFEDPTIVNNTGLVFSSAFNAFVETSTKPSGSAIQYQVSSDDGATYEWWSGAAWVARSLSTSEIIASAITTNTGTVDAGNLASIQTLDASTYDVSEVTGVPGFDIEIDFNAISGPPDQITIHGYYSGSGAHVVNVDIWNYVTSAWDNLGTLPNAGSITQYDFPVTGTKSDYLSGMASKMRIYHATSGNATHDIFLDYVYFLATPTNNWYYDNESNSAATINTNITALAVSGTFKFNAFLHSNTGVETPILDTLQVGNISYPITDPTIESDNTFPFTAALEDFTETSTKPGSTEIQYIVSIDGGSTFLWWSGAAWVASNGTYAESNLASVVDTNIAALGASGTFTYKAFLHTSDITATPELNNVHTQYTVAPSDTFNITDQDGNPIDTSGFAAYISGGTTARVYEIESPYEEADLPQLKYAQKSDIMYIDHPDYLPRKLTRFGDGTWTLEPYTRTNDPYLQKAITNITQANPGQVTSAAHGYETGDDVLIEDVSGMIEVNHGVYTITKVDDDNYTIGVNTSGFTAYISGGFSMFDGDAPATPAFYGGRAYHSGSANDPDFLSGSRAPDPADGATRYEDFTVGSLATDGVAYALTSASATTTDRVRFLVGTRSFLAAGTYAGMLKVNGGSDVTPISGTAIQSFPVDNFGVADIMPVNFGTDIIYVQRGGEVVYSFKYTLLSDGYKSEDETLQSDEITLGGLTQIAYQQGNPNQIWAAANDGVLRTFVYSDVENVSAWNTHPVGGSGSVFTVAAQPQVDNRDRVWIGVTRVINGVTRRYVEYLAKNPRIPERTDFYTGADEAARTVDDTTYRDLMYYAQKRQFHMDSALSLDTTQTNTITPAATSGDSVSFSANASMFASTDVGRRIQVKYLVGGEVGIAQIVAYVSETEVTCKILQDFASTDIIPSGAWYFTQDTVSGLGHLEGETVSVVADGGIHPNVVVTNGSITLGAQATYVLVGLFYFGRLKTMPLELLLTTGITPGKFKTINKVNLMFRNSLGVSYGVDPYNMQRIGFREGPQYTSRPTFLFNGVKEQTGFDNFDEQSSMWIIQTVPYPCTLNAMVFDMDFSEEN